MEEIENWKDIVGYEGLYRVSSFGRIKRLSKVRDGSNAILPEKILSPNKAGRYCGITLTINMIRTTYLVHRVVAIAFLPNPENKETVNHKDGIKQRNFLSNLEWATQKENIHHSWNNKLATSRKGTKHHSCKLTEMEVFEIRKMAKSKIDYREIAKKFNVAKSTITNIKKGKSWAHLT